MTDLTVHLVTNSVTCAPCRIFKPVWDGVKQKMPGVEFVEHDIMDDGMDFAQEYGVMSTPTVLVLDGDQIHATIVERDPIPFHTAVRAAVGLSAMLREGLEESGA